MGPHLRGQREGRVPLRAGGDPAAHEARRRPDRQRRLGRGTKTGRAGLAAYCASKAAVVSFTQALAEELGPANVAVNALCPGYIQTAMWTEVLNPILSGMFGVPPERVFEEFVQRFTYLRREQTPEDIADAAVYLCRAENVTGITLTVAGGGEVH